MRIKYRLLLLLAMLLCGVATTWAAQKVVVAPTTNGTVAVDNAAPTAGATVTVTVTPADRYQIAKSDIEVVATIDPGNAQAPALMEAGPGVGMKIDLVGDDPANLNDARTYTFTMPAEPYNVLITAKFTGMTEFNITVDDAIENGNVTVDKTTAVEGETVTITAIPAQGYEVDTYYYKAGGNTVTLTGNTFDMPGSDVVVGATFKLKSYTVTAGACDNGSVTTDKQTATMGETVTITATPAAGYELDAYNVACETLNLAVTVNADGTFTMPADNVTVTATFKKSTYTVTVNPSENGTVVANPTSGNMGDEITLTITPAEGYELESVTVTGINTNVAVTVNADGTFTMPADDVTVSATFKKSTYTVTVNPVENGTVVANPTSGNMGDEITLTITPAEGYELESVTVTGVNTNVAVTVTDGKFTMPADDVTVSATFKKSTYTVTVNPVENGTVVANPTSGNMGDEITLTITPAEGYELESVTVTGVNTNVAVTVTDGKFTMPADNVTVTATFKKSTYTVTVNPVENGTVVANPTSGNMGDEITLTITPAEGYELESVTVTGVNTNVAVTVTGGKFTMPADDVVVIATFREIPVTTYTITVNPSDNGTVTPSKTEAAEGDVITLTVTPAEGYELETLTVMMGETPVTVTADNTFTMPAGNVVVSATFKEIVHTYNVVGEPAELFGTGEAWDPVSSDANMTLGADGNYTWTSQPTYLNGETVQFKVVQDRSWDSGCYPEGDNVKIEGLKPGTYTVTVTFNPETGEVTYTVDGQADVYVWGIFDGTIAANEGVKMTSEDGKIYTASITVSDFNAGYSFFAMSHTLGANANDWTTLNAHRFMAESEGDFLVSGPMMNKELGLVYKNDASMKIPAGEYTLTLDLENMKLTITGGTQLSYILESGVEGVDYTVINDLVVVEKHDGTAQFFTSDGNNNWITLKGGDFYADAALIEAMKGGHVSGVFSDKNLNPYLTLTVAPEEAEDATTIEPEVYSLADAFSPKVDEVITVSKAYYKASENTLRAYAPGPTQGQSLTVDTSLFDYNFKDGRQYTVLGVINIKEPWNAKVDGIAPQDYNYPFQNYKLLVLDVTEHPASTAIDDILAEQGVKSVRYFNAAGLESNVPFPGVNIIVKEMNDGSKVTTKAIVK
ncbi:MAG: SusF/SusE family outer membrane protein [Muribaculaceae bacterium]|nr:SusF/SusE family outer membrane protein [Muribaculaceae bacterium]